MSSSVQHLYSCKLCGSLYQVQLTACCCSGDEATDFDEWIALPKTSTAGDLSLSANRKSTALSRPFAEPNTVAVIDRHRKAGVLFVSENGSETPRDGTRLIAWSDYQQLSDYVSCLEQALMQPDDIAAEPADDYEALRAQFLSLRTLANAQSRTASHLHRYARQLNQERALRGDEALEAERDTNAKLTDALVDAERRADEANEMVDRLKVEAAALRIALSDAEAFAKV